MTITFTLPLVGHKPTTSKDMVLSILVDKHPLALIELQNAIEKQYAKRLSFQSVRQAVLELTEAKVLRKEGKAFAISTDWIQELIVFGNKLQHRYLTTNKQDMIAVGPNMTVYTLSNMAETDVLWNHLIRDIFNDPKQPKEQVFTGTHFWFMLITLAQETALINALHAKGVQSHFICYNDTPIDAWSVRCYTGLGVHSKYVPRPADLQPGLCIGAYGDCIIKVQYSADMERKLDAFYRKYKSIEDAKLDEIVAITSEEVDVQLTVIKDPVLARNFRESGQAHFVAQ